MKKSLRVDAEAEDEIEHAIEHYEDEREGLGLEFWAELSDAMDTLDDPGPECGPVIGLPPELGRSSQATIALPLCDRLRRGRNVRTDHLGDARTSTASLLAPTHLRAPEQSSR